MTSKYSGMNKLFACCVSIFFLLGICCNLSAQILSEDTDIIISKSWSQEPDGWIYPIEIRVPEGEAPEGGFPALVLLHGNGGNGNGMANQMQNIFDCHILVAPSGYLSSWNISNEQSEAPDVEMVAELVVQLQGYQNVNANQIRLLGLSNGGALANRILIENDNPGIDAICAGISQLSEAQYHDGQFYMPSGETGGPDPYDGYDTPVTPIQGRKYLSICNEDDGLIPYEGGPAVGVVFLSAQEAAYIVAQSQGYTGSQLSDDGVAIEGSDMFEYSYLSGQVVHVKGFAGHGVPPFQLQYVRDFLRDCSVEVSVQHRLHEQVNFFPNPCSDLLQVRSNEPLDQRFLLLDISGRTLMQGVLQSGITQISLAEVQAGIYILKIADRVERLVKL